MTALPANTPGGTSFLARYEGLRDRLPGRNIPAIHALREAAAEILRTTGLPTRRVEAWRYTDITAVSRAEFREPLLSVESGPPLPAKRCEYRAVFLDGRFQPDLSELPPHAAPLSEHLVQAAGLLGEVDALRPAEALNAMLFELSLIHI